MQGDELLDLVGEVCSQTLRAPPTQPPHVDDAELAHSLRAVFKELVAARRETRQLAHRLNNAVADVLSERRRLSEWLANLERQNVELRARVFRLEQGSKETP
jgi:hypothetical protein